MWLEGGLGLRGEMRPLALLGDKERLEVDLLAWSDGNEVWRGRIGCRESRGVVLLARLGVVLVVRLGVGTALLRREGVPGRELIVIGVVERRRKRRGRRRVASKNQPPSPPARPQSEIGLPSSLAARPCRDKQQFYAPSPVGLSPLTCSNQNACLV